MTETFEVKLLETPEVFSLPVKLEEPTTLTLPCELTSEVLFVEVK